MFYKNIINYITTDSHIERQFNTISTTDPDTFQRVYVDGGIGNCDVSGFCDYSVLRPLNGGKATVKGFTLNYQQPFGNTGFGIYTNYTFADGSTASGQDLPYNSRNAYNISPYYEQGPFSARLTYGWRSHYLAGGYVAGAPPASVDDYAELDASAIVALQRELLAELQRDEPARRDVPAVSRREGHDRRQVQDRPPLHGLVAFRVLTFALGTRWVTGPDVSVRTRCFSGNRSRRSTCLLVIPAKAGIQFDFRPRAKALDSGFRRNDEDGASARDSTRCRTRNACRSSVMLV